MSTGNGISRSKNAFLGPSDVEMIPARPQLRIYRFTLWTIVSLILLGAGAGAGGYYAYYRELPLIAYLSLIPVLVMIIWGYVLIPLQVRNLSWGIGEQAIYVRKGVLFASLKVMPLPRVQYAEESTNPLLRMIGQAKITVSGATTSELVIQGVSQEEAKEICALIMAKAHANLAGL